MMNKKFESNCNKEIGRIMGCITEGKKTEDDLFEVLHRFTCKNWGNHHLVRQEWGTDSASLLIIAAMLWFEHPFLCENGIARDTYSNRIAKIVMAEVKNIDLVILTRE